MMEKRILALILILFLLCGSLYAIVTPVFEASDELWHYPMVRHLADGNPLPVQVFNPQQAGPWKQEASQPPLYYYLGAALTFWIDTGDMDEVRRLNPHVDNGVITEDGNVNLVVHDPQASRWQGTLLAVRLVRFASVLLGAATVYLTYRIAREVAPRRPELYLGAAALNAFTPMFLFISGAVNNDNLAIPLSSLAILLMIRIVKAGKRPASWQGFVRRWAPLGLVIGLAALTKEGTLGLLPLAWGTAFVVAWHQYSTSSESGLALRPLVARLARAAGRSLAIFAFTLLPVVAVAGWWYLRNYRLYGDWLGWSAFLAVLGQRSQPASLAQLWDERWGFLASYWGLFGGVNVPMWSWIYDVLNGLLLLAVAGFAAYLLQLLRRRYARRSRPWHIGTLLAEPLAFLRDHFALVVCVLFSAAVILGLVRWATTTWSSQGRLAFTAISTLSTLLVMGLAAWMPRRPAQITMGAVAGFMFLVSVSAPFLWIAPAYEIPGPATTADLQPIDVTFGERMHLYGYDVSLTGDDDPVLHPGDTLQVTLAWEALRPMTRNWSVFVHLNDPVLQAPLAQRDMYPGQGLLATRLMDPGQRVVSHYQLRIPQAAVAPSHLELAVGLYDFQSGGDRRLRDEQGRDALVLQELDLVPLAGAYPNATSVNFGEVLELVGYSVAPRRLESGGELSLTLHWQALKSPAQDYTFFAQVLDDVDTTRWAANDLRQPTTAWSPAEDQTVSLPMTLGEDTPAGVYPIIIGAYTRGEDGTFHRLQIVREGRITMEDALTLTRIRVD